MYDDELSAFDAMSNDYEDDYEDDGEFFPCGWQYLDYDEETSEQRSQEEQNEVF